MDFTSLNPSKFSLLRVLTAPVACFREFNSKPELTYHLRIEIVAHGQNDKIPVNFLSSGIFRICAPNTRICAGVSVPHFSNFRFFNAYEPKNYLLWTETSSISHTPSSASATLLASSSRRTTGRRCETGAPAAARSGISQRRRGDAACRTAHVNV